MFTWLWNGLLGLLGVRHLVIPFKASEYAEFRQQLKPGAHVVIRPVEAVNGESPDGLSNAIQTGSCQPWSHSENYFGASSGKNGIPGETVGALAQGVAVHSLDEYGTSSFQMVAFNPINLDNRTFSILKERIYSKVGQPYDDWKIAHFATPFIPDLGNGIVCSTLTAMARMGHAAWEWNLLFNILPKGILPEDATPGDTYNGSEPLVKNFEMLKYNC